MITKDLNDFKEFLDINGTDYHVIISEVKPYIDSNTTTHYLMVCVPKVEAYQPIQDMYDNYSDTYIVIFWVVLVIAIITFLVISSLIHITTKKISKHLKDIEKVFSRIVNRGLFPVITKTYRDSKLDKAKKTMPGLINRCRERIEKIKLDEEEFSYYEWEITRPNDRFLFQE